MNSKYNSLLGAVSSLVLAGTLLLAPGAFAQESAGENVQVLTRGPVHEAFAESISYEPQPGLIISSRVPEPIEELPPEQKPEGDNVTWISGYWAWDDDQNDFIWISGIWRNLPPGRQWVPGYWNDIGDGKYQWTAGYWADATIEVVSYVPTPPPRSVDSGPNVDAPSRDHSWIPGNWFWVDNRYAWRPGYWVPLRSNWTWVPSRYCWTRRGYVYVDGYWDYAVAGRGVLFAPVYFRDRYYDRPDYSYTPLIVVALNVFSNHLFVRPRYGQYYFGDYYAPRYQTSGFCTSYSWGTSRGGYDPIYAYDRWQHRDDQTWNRRRQEDYNYFRDNEDARPPRTWAAMKDYRSDRFTDGRSRTYAAPLSTFTQDPAIPQKFSSIDPGARQQFVFQNKEMRKFTQERRQTETRALPAGAEPGKAMAIREKTNRSPITGREAGMFSEKEAPPKRPEARGNKTEMRPITPGVPEGRADQTQGAPRREFPQIPGGNKDPQREELTRPQPQPTPGRGVQVVPAPRPERQPPQVAPQPTYRREPQVPQRQEQVRPQPQPRVQVAPRPERQPQVPQRQQPVRPQPQAAPQPVPGQRPQQLENPGRNPEEGKEMGKKR